MAATEVEPSFVRKHAVRFGNGVVVHAEIDGELAHGRQRIADGKYPVHQQCPNGIRDLPISRLVVERLKQIAHAASPNSSRPMSMRRISEVPAPISYSLASRNSLPVG